VIGRARQEALVAYVTMLQHELKLDHWEIFLDFERPPDSPDNPLAQTRVTFESDEATTRYSLDIESWEPESLRQTVIHELIHLFVEHALLDTSDAIQRMASEQAHSAWHSMAKREWERIVDRIATAIAPHYDLLTWPDEPAEAAQGADMGEGHGKPAEPGRSDEALDPDRAPGTGLGDAGEASTEPDVNPGDEAEQGDESDDGADDTDGEPTV
jgi:hypothetical protein